MVLNCSLYVMPPKPKWSEVKITQSCLTLCDPMDHSLPGSSVHGILQARILSGLPLPSPEDLPNPGTEPGSPALEQILYHLSHQGSPSTCIRHWNSKSLYGMYLAYTCSTCSYQQIAGCQSHHTCQPNWELFMKKCVLIKFQRNSIYNYFDFIIAFYK